MSYLLSYVSSDLEPRQDAHDAENVVQLTVAYHLYRLSSECSRLYLLIDQVEPVRQSDLERFLAVMSHL